MVLILEWPMCACLWEDIVLKTPTWKTCFQACVDVLELLSWKYFVHARKSLLVLRGASWQGREA